MGTSVAIFCFARAGLSILVLGWWINRGRLADAGALGKEYE